ncbi:MAG TPA: YibE/F family protein [Acidimicrobiales bacterium]|nr:YibE/F family protein [Acidimicrobiales bacterium]
MGTGHSHSHGHGHGHGDLAVAESRERALFVAAIVCGIATIVGMALLRPTGDIHGSAAESGIQSERFKGTVTEATRELCSYATTDNPRTCLGVKVLMKQGPDKGSIIDLGESGQIPAEDPFAPKLEKGDAIILGYEPANDVYFYTDRDRRNTLFILGALFAAVVIALGRWRGVTALIALGASVAVLLQFIVPSVLDGHSPLLVAIVGSSAVAFIALYMSTGFNTMTTVALLGTLATLALIAILGWAFIAASKFTGLSEEASYLRIVTDVVDVRGLLLGGVVIGALGALDDMTVTQASAVWELRRANPALTRRDLYRSALRIGRDHVGATVNTLLLAYAGASLPLMLLFVLSDQSLGTVANSEVVAVEIVRTLVGSIGLVAAVPATTLLASWVVDAPASS